MKKKVYAKSKKDKTIKRIYKKGKETTILSAKKSISKKRRIKKAVIKAENIPTRAVLFDNYELPSSYDKTYITLMVKDPYWVYAYWEVSAQAVKLLEKQISYEQIKNAKVILRMYDVTLVDFNGTNANSYFDIEAGNLMSNWYINLWKDAVSYVGEIGLRIPNGRFLALARSNFVHTPRVSYSSRCEQIWMNVQADKPISTYVVSVVVGENIQKKRKVISLSEEEIRHYYANLSPLLRDIISSRLNRLYGRRLKYRFLLEGESEDERMRILSRLPKNYFIKKLVCGSSEEFILLGMNNPLGASDFAYTQEEQYV